MPPGGQMKRRKMSRDQIYSQCYCYRPRSEGDNALGSVRPSVRPFVCLSVLSRVNRLTYDLDFWHGGRP